MRLMVRALLVTFILAGLPFLDGCSDAKTRKALSGPPGASSAPAQGSGAAAAQGAVPGAGASGAGAPYVGGAGSDPGALPGAAAELQKALAQPSPLVFDVRVVADTGGKSADAYLDSMGDPPTDTLLLTVFSSANYDLRFATGARLRELNIRVDEILSLARTHYFPEALKGNPAGGLASLITAINQRAAGR